MKSRIIKILLQLIMMVVFTSCEDKENKDPQILNIATSTEARSLDPQKTNELASWAIMAQIYDTLFEFDEDRNIKSNLAKNWRWLDSTTLEIELEEGVTFHNGDKLTSKDVIYSLNRAINSSVVQDIFEAIDRVEAIDKYRVKITTKYHFSPLLAHLTHIGSSIVNEKSILKFKEDYGQNPIGTGAFKLNDWIIGEEIALEKNSSYFKGEAGVNLVKFIPVIEGSTRTMRLETGEVDIAYNVLPIDIQTIEKDKNIGVISEPSLGINFIGFNTSKPPFNDKNLRKAIAYAIDGKAIIDASMYGTGEVINSAIGDNILGYTNDRIKYTQNIKLAKEYLAKSGYPNGVKATFFVTDKDEVVEISQMVQYQLSEIGVTLKIVVLEWGTFLQQVSKGNHDMFWLGWTSVTGDADYGLTIFDSKSFGSAGNRFFYKNQKVDKLLALAKKEKEKEKRDKYYKIVQQIIQEDAVMALSYRKKIIFGVNNRVKNLVIDPGNMTKLYKVKKIISGDE